MLMGIASDTTRAPRAYQKPAMKIRSKVTRKNQGDTKRATRAEPDSNGTSKIVRASRCKNKTRMMTVRALPKMMFWLTSFMDD